MRTLILAVLIVSMASVTAHAMGPLMVDAHRAVWDANVEPDLSGYYLYWRTVGETAWSNVKRSTLIVKTPTPSFDLLTIGLPNGSYEICVTATDVLGNESGASNIVPFPVDIPGAPANLRKQ